ncbi:MAG: hypothetical protein R3D29_09565 [Nitratireductor sp.]
MATPCQRRAWTGHDTLTGREWAHALRSGPGVIVIKRAMADISVVDRATETSSRR